ncbi:unnamed protein product [Cylindrotheca closterium]|uniref:CRAL-TRIO domain-containing protein n=1 Tax=Cylindrotheca closterium TaxID=2856 RepID=A0AAD2G433_9STRA|nr:unnamed protein product [Cylindrotheca closterium]
MAKIMFPKAALALMQNMRQSNANDSSDGGSSFTTDDRCDSSISPSKDGSFQYPRTQKEEECLRKLKEECRLANISASDITIFRFACFHDFNFDVARPAMIAKYNDPRLHLRMDDELLDQFQNKVIFPLPGLRTKNMKHEVLYFYACRHFPATMDTDLLLRNMTYILNDMSLTEQQCRNGVVMIIDLNHFTFKNFTPESSNKFFEALQQVPTKVETTIILNGPRWFPKVYRHLFKKMLSKENARRVLILKQPQQLQNHLMDGCEKYLPVEMGYWVDSTEIVEDFVDWKRYNEFSQ